MAAKNPRNTLKPELLQNHPIPKRVWTDILKGIIVPLLRARGCASFYVVVVTDL